MANLKSYPVEQQCELDERQHQLEARKRFAEAQFTTRKSQLKLEELSSQLNSLVSELGTQEGGYKFQDWFYDLMDFFDISSRRPYWQSGRQIDGSITLKDTTYLVELKFSATQIDVTEVDSFIRKVTTKADNTMGVFVSMSGFSSVAIERSIEREVSNSALRTLPYILRSRGKYELPGFSRSCQKACLSDRKSIPRGQTLQWLTAQWSLRPAVPLAAAYRPCLKRSISYQECQ